LLAETKTDPQRLFVLWAVAVRFCRSVEDFQEHFGPELQIEALVDSLLSNGFLNSTEGLLRLTELGETAIEDLEDKAPSEHSEGRQRSSRKVLNIGVVGVGYWGPNFIRNFRSLPNCRLKVMCDVSETRLKHLRTLYPDVEGLTDFEHFLNRVGLEAVVVAAPVKHHYSLAKASLIAGKHTLIEKPMASSSAECEELIEIAAHKGLVLMVGHTFLYSAPVRKIVEIVQAGDIGEIRYINSRRLNLGLFQKDINVAWDLAPHDISIILHVLGEFPRIVNCQGNAHVTPGVEDVTNISLSFRQKRFATIQSSWLEPRKTREMTIVGTRRMIVYDDLQPHEKIRIYDVRVERPPHYDTFADFHYSYHYGDSYIPYIKQEEPMRAECQHFLDCIESKHMPLTGGRFGLEVVRVLEAASASLKRSGAPVTFTRSETGPSFPVENHRDRTRVVPTSESS
jgi:predicted dehydrogenase